MQIEVVSQRPTRHGEEEEFVAAVEEIVGETTAFLGGAQASVAVRLMTLIRGAHRIYTLGAGRSKLVADAFAMRLMHLGHEAHAVGEVTAPGIRHESDLLVVCSGSGETPTVVHMARAAARAGSRLVVVTATPGSTLARHADLVVALPERGSDGTPDASSQFVGTLFEQGALLYLDAIVLTMERRTAVDRTAMLARHTNME